MGRLLENGQCKTESVEQRVEQKVNGGEWKRKA